MAALALGGIFSFGSLGISFGDAVPSWQAVTIMFSHFLLKDTSTVLAVVVSVLGYSYPWWTTAW